MSRASSFTAVMPQMMVDASSDGLIGYELIRDARGRAAGFRRRVANPAAERILGDPVRGPVLEGALPERATEDLFQQYVHTAIDGVTFRFEKVVEDGQGRVHWAMSLDVRFLPGGLAVALSDITQRTQELRDWKQRTERLMLLARRSSDVASLHDHQGFCVWASPAALTVLGTDAEAMKGTSLLQRVHAEDRAVLAPSGQLLTGRTVRVRAGIADEERWLEISLEEHGREVLAITRDVTRAHHLERRIAELAPEDGLPGVAVRKLFLEQLEKEIARRKRYGRPVSVVCIALDGHKALQQGRGDLAVHRAQHVLAEVAATVLRTSDLIGRWSDEVLILLLPETPATGAVRAGQRLAEGLEDRLVDGAGEPFHVSLCAGVTAVDADDTSKTVLQRAGRALSAARKRGTSQVLHAEVKAVA